ncbi:inovirus Gp2 family protein [Enterobacter ludwigii]
MSYTYEPYWQQRIADTFNCALNAYTRVLALRVDLRLPDTPAATDAAVISRFTDALKSRIDALQMRQRREGKRVWPTTLRFVWAREFGEIKGKKHYHAVLLLNRDTWCGPGDYQDPETLAGMIKRAWCSALKVDAGAHAVLARFPKSPVSWLTRGDDAQLQQALLQASYLAKLETKATGDGERNFGCSRG